MIEKYMKRLDKEIRPIVSYGENELKRRFNMFVTASNIINGKQVMLYITPISDNDGSACSGYYIRDDECIIKMDDVETGDNLGSMHFPIKDDHQIFYDLMFEDIMNDKKMLIELLFYDGEDNETLYFLYADK